MEGRQNLVVYIGLSASGAREAHELSLLGNRVLLVASSGIRGQVHLGNRNFDLTQKSEISAFASSLGLPAARASALADVLATAGSSSRDKLGQSKGVDSWPPQTSKRSRPSSLAPPGPSRTSTCPPAILRTT